MQWDLFCRVVDNFGDAGVCWRLACNLAERGEQVRLWIDDASALAWMAPGGAPGVQLGAFDAAQHATRGPGDVVVETFGCNPPPAFVARMQERRPVWINLEYLSAEGYVERSHGLPSPQPGGLMKWFFYPGFTPATGGLLREPGLLARRETFQRDMRDAWLASVGIERAPSERVVSLFCYTNAAIPALLAELAHTPTLLLLTPGPAQAQVSAAPPGVRCVALPWLSQTEYDQLLWASELNFVRGEDSLVRALWAARPFVWQIYPQHDGAHAAKLQALLQRLPPLAGLAPLWQAWNGLQAAWPGLPDASAWQQAAAGASAALAQQPSLASQLRAFVQEKMARPG